MYSSSHELNGFARIDAFFKKLEDDHNTNDSNYLRKNVKFEIRVSLKSEY